MASFPALGSLTTSLTRKLATSPRLRAVVVKFITCGEKGLGSAPSEAKARVGPGMVVGASHQANFSMHVRSASWAKAINGNKKKSVRIFRD